MDYLLLFQTIRAISRYPQEFVSHPQTQFDVIESVLLSVLNGITLKIKLNQLYYRLNHEGLFFFFFFFFLWVRHQGPG